MKIAGVAKGKNGSGLGGVTVTIHGPALPQGKTTICRPDGSFEFSDIPDGQYQATAKGPGAAGGQVIWTPSYEPTHQLITDQESPEGAPGSESDADILSKCHKLDADIQSKFQKINAQLEQLNDTNEQIQNSLAKYVAMQHGEGDGDDDRHQPSTEELDQMAGYTDQLNNRTNAVPGIATRLIGLATAFVTGWKLQGARDNAKKR